MNCGGTITSRKPRIVPWRGFWCCEGYFGGTPWQAYWNWHVSNMLRNAR